jgi:hypothetical protein
MDAGIYDSLKPRGLEDVSWIMGMSARAHRWHVEKEIQAKEFDAP